MYNTYRCNLFDNYSTKGKKTWNCVRAKFSILLKLSSLQSELIMGFPCGSAGKESSCNADSGFDPGLGRSPAEGKGYPLQYSDLENSLDCIVHGITKSQT